MIRVRLSWDVTTSGEVVGGEAMFCGVGSENCLFQNPCPNPYTVTTVA